MIRWDAPGPYVVAFPTRNGGVSVGPYASLNLGLLTDDEPANVEQNRSRLCEAVGADLGRLAMNRQVHAAAESSTGGRLRSARSTTPACERWSAPTSAPRAGRASTSPIVATAA